MEKPEQVSILTALIEHIENGTTTDAGGIMRAPMSDFTCPEILAKEQDAVDGSFICAAGTQYILGRQCNWSPDTYGARW